MRPEEVMGKTAQEVALACRLLKVLDVGVLWMTEACLLAVVAAWMF
jgi:hypothetical protein